MEHEIHPELLSRPVRTLVVGCGTVGTAVGTSLPYLHRALLALGHPGGLDVELVDDDTVSHGSCRAQPFRSADVGEFKSVALAERLNAGWDVAWRGTSAALAGRGPLEETDIVIGCAQTARLRGAIAEHVSGASTVGYWLDLASSTRGSQFVLGEPLNRRNPRSRGRLRDVAELYPAALEPSFDTLIEGDGPEGHEPFVAQIVASHAMVLLVRLFTDGRVSHQGGFVGPRGALRPLPVGRLQAARSEPPVIEYD